MTSNHVHKGFLRQLPSQGEVEQRYLLSTTQEMVLGREPDCQVTIDPFLYGCVSRRHAKIQPVSVSSSNVTWQVCDLGSANGTYINNVRLKNCQILSAGDRITLGENGPEFIFEYQPAQNTTQSSVASNSLPHVNYHPPVLKPVNIASQNLNTNVTSTQLFPFFSVEKDFTQKTYLIPASITVVFTILMFSARGNPLLFNFLLATYISGAAYYFVYRLCGKHKPWWVLLGSALMTMLIVCTPMLLLFIFIFRGILPGNIEAASPNFLSQLIAHFFGAGLMEELLKALPVLVAFYIGKQHTSPKREQIDVWEPLDGILLGAASAIGFTLVETLGQYVPAQVQSVALRVGIGAGELMGLQLLIPRILGSVAGHIAYSGYLGYFIGLSVLKPKKRWSILSVGYLSAAGLHGFWNATASTNNFLITAVVGILSYAFLAAAILKARKLSPTRTKNFATHFSNYD